MRSEVAFQLIEHFILGPSTTRMSFLVIIELFFKTNYSCGILQNDVPRGVTRTSNVVRMACFVTKNSPQKQFFGSFQTARIKPQSIFMVHRYIYPLIVFKGKKQSSIWTKKCSIRFLSDFPHRCSLLSQTNWIKAYNATWVKPIIMKTKHIKNFLTL